MASAFQYTARFTKVIWNMEFITLDERAVIHGKIYKTLRYWE